VARPIKALKASTVAGNYAVVVATVDMSASYPTGGEIVSFATLGGRFAKPFFVLPRPIAGYVFEFDHAAMKLKAYQQSAATGALTEVPNATNLSAVKDVRMLVVG
jgi:hypothetical protein